MGKEIVGSVRLLVEGGKANPGSKDIAPKLGSKGINSMEFCKEFNARTKGRESELLPVKITIYEDKTISFVVKSEPVSVALLKAVKAEKGSGTPNVKKVGEVSMETIRKIAEKKKEDLNCYDIDSAIRIVTGTANSLGIDVVDRKV